MEDSTMAPLYAATDEQYDRAVQVVGDLAALTTWLADNLATMPAGLMDTAVGGGVRIGTFTADDFRAVCEWLNADRDVWEITPSVDAGNFRRHVRSFGEFSITVYVRVGCMAVAV